MTSTGVEKQKWSPFFNLLLKSKLPWIWFILNLVIGLGLSTISVKLPQLAGEILQGNIFDQSLISQYVTLSIVIALSSIAMNIFGGWINLHTDRKLQKTVWKKFIRMPMTFLNKLNPSSLTSRVTSDTATVSYGINYCFTLVNITYTLVLMLKTIYDMNQQLVFAILALIPYILIVTILPGRFKFRAQNKIQSTYSVFTNFVTERLTNLRLIKSSGSEEIEVQQGIGVARQQYKSEIYLAKVELITSPFIMSVNAICKIIVIIYGGILVGNKQLELGQLITIYMYTETISFLVLQYIHCYQYMKIAQGATSKIGEIMESESETFERKKSFAIPDDDIRFVGVSFSYGNEQVLSNVNLTIPKGKMTAIVGPSGSGKTSILNLIERFYLPDTGQVKFGHENIEHINLDEWRNAIGYMSQNSPLLSGSIRDNIVYGLHREVHEDEVIRAAKLANAYGFIEALPEGLNTDVGELGAKLSGGERQRIAIARTVIKNPDYLLLDEATSNLDAQNEHEVQIALNNLMKGRTTVMVTHNIKSAANADHIVVLDRGEVQAAGEHGQIYKENSLYRRYYDLEFFGVQ